MHKLLLVDDDYELIDLLKELLELEGFEVQVAYDGEQALSKLNNAIDLLLLDIMMPKKNGIDTLKEIRQKKHHIPIIMLTARGSELDRILGLELGADDYLTKPFNDRELVARIRAILRRSYWFTQKNITSKQSSVLVDLLNLNPGRQEACFGDINLNLTGTEFSLLFLLAQNLGQVVSREYLSQEILGKKLTPFDRAIDMHISNLRKKLPPRNDARPWFKTLRGKGYLMVSAT
ncbi:MAG: envelope stress response regulator transcription factor CpxR [Wigglesworthia glossinidia]|uniref:Uncharacterized protein n=1 Tax=Glossina palpalis gambiensis TaxID=67801 RepID=A0A1B0C7G0_9MUSC|nr:envelope stress response regulator transcription factor CpxR [Wigglesworthia glossinidia]